MRMNRNAELLKNTALLTFGKMCTQFISFLLLPLYTMLLDPAEFGVVDLFSTYISLLLPLICWQYDQGLFRFMLDVRDDHKAISGLFSSVAVLNLMQCIVSTALMLVVFQFISTDYDMYLIICVILNVFSGLLMQFARGLGKMFHYSVGSFLTAAGTVALNVLCIVILDMGVDGMFLAMVGGLAINCVYLLFAIRVWQYFNVRLFDCTLLKDVGRYSVPMIPNQISGWVLSASNRTIITFFIDVAANGVFSVAAKFSNLVATFYSFFNMAWVETVSVHFNDQDRDEYISSMIQNVLTLFTCVCCGVIACMPFIFDIMVDAKYAEAYYQIPILMISVIFQVLMGLLSSIYIALKKSTTIAKTTVLGAIINATVHIISVNFVGLYAASVATALSYAVVSVYRLFDVRRYILLKVSIKRLILLTGMVTLITTCYYLNSLALNVISLVVVIILTLVFNKEMLFQIVVGVKERLSKGSSV